jgi:hypothetical protein
VTKLVLVLHDVVPRRQAFDGGDALLVRRRNGHQPRVLALPRAGVEGLTIGEVLRRPIDADDCAIERISVV